MGLYSQENSFTVPDGALEQANNVVLSKDRVISKRRGFYQYYDPSSDTLNSLHLYENRLVSVFTNKISYLTNTGSTPNLTATSTTLSGATVAVTAPRVSRSVQSNNNLYLTSDSGMLKLESFDGTVYKSGTPPALDLRGRFVGGVNGPIASDTQVAWRIVFGRRDSNDNLILGVPSDVFAIANTAEDGSWTRTANVVTVTTTDPHGIPTGEAWYITVLTSTGGSPEVTLGVYQATSTGASTFTFSQTAADDGSGNTLTYVVNYKTRLEFSVPTEITTVNDGYFYQIYRSSKAPSSADTPEADYKLIDEQKLTTAEITANLVVYDDEIDDILRGAELYTNPNSREGELQANDRPPLCNDVTLFKNHVIYGRCTSRHLLDFSVIDSTALVSGDFVEVKVDATTRRYVARTGVGNATVSATATFVATTITVNYTAHGLVVGDTIYVTDAVGTGTLPAGTYAVATTPTADSFTFTASATPTTLTKLDFQGVTNGTYPIFQLNSASTSASLRLRDTASGLVKAINRDDSSLVYAKYISGLTETPGKMRLQAKAFTGVIYLRANSAAAGAGFSPILPDSFVSGDQVFSRNDVQPNFLYVSKVGEPEAVPLVNNFPVGARNKEILRVVALRDCVIVLKEDGVFRLNGDAVSNFSVTALDNTVFCLEASSVGLLNNEVFAFSNQGVCRISDSSVQIVSRTIEDPIAAIVGSSSLATNAQAVTYESERLYILSTLNVNETSNTIVYAYNALNDSWVTWDTTFKQGVIGPNDTLYLITTGNKIHKERKNQTKIDFCGQNYATTVNTVASDALSATITVTGAAPVAGDAIVKSDVFSKIVTVTGGSNPFTVTFARATNLAASDSVILYAKYDSAIKLAPFHAGLVGRMKQFSQMQVHLRDEAISVLDISYTGATYGGSELITWRASAIGSTGGGWGSLPWGFFPWGETDGINKTVGTRNAPIIRVYVPLFQQRNTFIQPFFEHKVAGEAINIQAIAFAVRSYGERTSR